MCENLQCVFPMHLSNSAGISSIPSALLLPAIHSLEQKVGICFTVCFFVFFCSINDFLTTRGPIYAKVCMRAYSLDVSSPLLGVSNPRRTEKRGNEIFVSIKVNGEFLHFGVFLDPHQILFVYGQCLPTCSLPLWGPSAPGGRGNGDKNSKNGVGLIRAANSYHFYFSQRFHIWFNM